MERDRNLNTKFNLSKLNDDQLKELMDSVEMDDECDGDDFSSDNEWNDPDYIPDAISPEETNCISRCIGETNVGETSEFFVQAVNMSLNVSAFDDAPSTSSFIRRASQASTSSATKTVASTASLVKPPKRPRSPLPSLENSGPSIVPSAGGFTGFSLDAIEKGSTEFSNIRWRKRPMCLHVNEVAFRGNSLLPHAIKELNTPMKIFCYFFSNEIVERIAEQTNLAAYQENISTTFKTDSDQIRQYIGILIYMSIYRYPNLESYWGKNAFPPIQKTMPIKKFMAIKKYLSFVDETQRIKKGEPGYDPLFRIRKLATELSVQFDSIPKTARLCVDEQMCSTKIKHHLRQYMPNKPHKWGIKLFVLCDSHGFAYQFEVYNGAGDNIVLPGTPDLGSTANVVVRLSQTVPNFVHHIIYFDNFYTSLPLLVYLRARGIYSLGTMRVNRIPNCKLPLDKEIKDEQRGYSTEYMGCAYGIDISSVLWKDNKSVRLASTYVGIESFARANLNPEAAKATRYDRKAKKFLEVECPQIIREYNSHMGGVDLMDGLMGRYHIRAKTRNPMIRLFYHFIDMAATNSYILYRRIHAEKFNDSANISADEDKLLKLPEFREEIAAALVAYKAKRQIGRPLSISSEASSSNAMSSQVGKKAKHPVQDVRFDKYEHFPVWLSKEGGKKKCKFCKTSQTQCICQKCDLHLCCSFAKNCFMEYHNQK